MSDALIMAGRSLRLSLRSPDALLTALPPENQHRLNASAAGPARARPLTD